MSNTSVPIKEFRLPLSDITFTVHDLVRPESILARPDGTLLVSDGRGGVTRIDPDGSQQFIGGLGGEPNGLAMPDDGSILVANIGTRRYAGDDGKTLQFVTSVTFGGPDLRTVYVGSLAMSSLPTFHSPVPGLPMRHWRR